MSRPLVLALLLAISSAASGHATLVLGEVRVSPDPPRPGSPFRVTVTLADPALAPVEDAVVRLELRAQAATAAPGAPSGAATPPPDAVVPLVETAPARYEAEIVLARADTYHVLVRDTTFEWEEATASLMLEVGGAPVGTIPFILPPTAIGPRSLWTWLLWLVGLPVVAGLVVTILVLTSGRPRTAPPAA